MEKPSLAGAAVRRLAVLCAIAGSLCATDPASAGSFDLERVLAERQERWRAARNGQLPLPLPGTPSTEQLLTQLDARGVAPGAPMLLRIFKAESQLEVWLKSGSTFTLFATYPVCYWSGALGPKLREGDRQAPEGFYTVTEDLLHHGTRWRQSLNIGYPNIFDRISGRSGSAILIHGGCDSSGCFAMTDRVNAELYDLVAESLRHTRHVPLQVFPFRMTDANMAANAASPWFAFWSDLKEGYDSFERTHLPPHVSVCGKRYRVRDASPLDGEAEAVALCEQDRDTVAASIAQAARAPKRSAKAERPAPACNLGRPSCRKWVALQERRHLSRTVAGRSTSAKRSAVR